MTNKLKRIFSLMLALVIIVGVLPALTTYAKADTTVIANQSNLDQALKNASSGTKIVLTESAELSGGSYTIPAGAILLIPYAPDKQTINGSTHDFPYANAEALGSTAAVKYPGSPTFDQAAIKLTLKNTTLTVNGQLIVGGQYSSATGPYSGQTAGAFGQIDMDSTSCITVSGSSAVLSSMGYITGGNIQVSSGAKVYEPFVITEHNGGSYCAVAYMTAKLSPFSSYTLMNIQSTMVLNYGTSLYGYCDIYASSQHNCSCALLIGSSKALFLLSNGSKATFSYSEENENGDSVQVSSRKVVGETRIQFDGNVTMGSLSMDVMSLVEVNTNTVYFPLPYNMELVQNSGTFTIPSDIEVKILPGAVFGVEQGAQLNVYGALVVFDGMNTIPYVSGYPYGSELVSGNQAERGKLLVNGTMTLADKSVFAGRVENDGTGVVSVGSNVTLNPTMIEGVDTSQTYAYKIFGYTLYEFGVTKTTKHTYHLKAQLVDHSAKYSSGSKLIDMQVGKTYYGVSNEGLVTETGHNYTPYQGTASVQNYHVPQTLHGSWSTSRVLYDDGTAVTASVPVPPTGKVVMLYSNCDMTEEITQVPEQGVVYYKFVDCDHVGSAHTEYEKKETTHSFICTICGGQSVEIEHSYGEEFQSTEAGHVYSCVCGKTKIEEHIWGENEKYDENQHSRSCKTENCDAKEFSDHQWSAYSPSENETQHERSCTGCGATQSGTHSWSNYTIVDEEQHSAVCEQCSAKLTEAHDWKDEFESTQDGHLHSCTHCSETMLANHVWADSFTVTDEGHVFNCTDQACDQTKLENHTWTDGGICVCGREAIHISAAEDKLVIYTEKIDISNKIIIAACYQTVGDEAGKMVSCGVGGDDIYMIPLPGLENGMLVRIFVLNSQHAPVDNYIAKTAGQ